MTADADGPQDATAVTRALNRAVLGALPFDDTRDFDDARRGLLATLPEIEIKNAQGRIVWSLRDYAFLEHAEAPPTVNPSLWRQARLNMHHGLFQVAERIYQIRGFDISNMTILEGERGIVVDRPADLHRDGAGRPRPVPAAPRPATGHRRHLYPQPRRPLRRRARRDRRGRCAGRPRRHLRARRVHGRSRQRERPGRHTDGAPGPVPVRPHAAQGTARPGRCRARQGGLARNRHAHPAHARDRAAARHPPYRRRSRSSSSWRRRPRRPPRCTCSIPA